MSNFPIRRFGKKKTNKIISILEIFRSNSTEIKKNFNPISIPDFRPHTFLFISGQDSTSLSQALDIYLHENVNDSQTIFGLLFVNFNNFLGFATFDFEEC